MLVASLLTFSKLGFCSTISKSTLKLRLLTSNQCTLCVHFKKQLTNYLSKNNQSRNFDIEEVNINSDKELFVVIFLFSFYHFE